MSLMSAIRGDSGKSGAPAFDGIWYCLLSWPSFCASGVSAQSTNFFAASRLRAPLTIDSEPIS
jgi:hypothetical protein